MDYVSINRMRKAPLGIRSGTHWDTEAVFGNGRVDGDCLRLPGAAGDGDERMHNGGDERLCGRLGPESERDGDCLFLCDDVNDDDCAWE